MVPEVITFLGIVISQCFVDEPLVKIDSKLWSKANKRIREWIPVKKTLAILDKRRVKLSDTEKQEESGGGPVE